MSFFSSLRCQAVACSVVFLSGGFALAQGNGEVWPMPKTFPAPPAGVPAAAFPLPRIDWPQRVANTNARAQKLADSIHLIFDGDSITDAWQGRGKKIWTDRYAKFGAFDFAISGDRTQHLLWRLSQGQVDHLHPRLVAVMIGTNNLGNRESVEDTIAGVKAVVADYRKRCPDAVILLQAIFPRGKEPGDPLRAKIKEVNGQIAKLADGGKVVYVDFGDRFLQPDGTISPEIMPDFLHPSEKGYQIWADAIQPFIDRYMKGSKP